MLETIVKREIIFYAMGFLMLFGVAAKLVSSFTVRKMVKAASEIQKSNHRLMKLVKAKFEHASMISDKVQNVEAFVDKYIYEYKVFGMRLSSWRTIPKKAVWIVGILGVFSIFECYRLAGISDLTIKYMQWTGIFVMFLLLLYYIVDEKSILGATKNYMVEYFENVCIHRYAKKNQSSEKQMSEEEPGAEEVDSKLEEKQEERKKSEQEVRIRAILEEFLA